MIDPLEGSFSFDSCMVGVGSRRNWSRAHSTFGSSSATVQRQCTQSIFGTLKNMQHCLSLSYFYFFKCPFLHRFLWLTISDQLITSEPGNGINSDVNLVFSSHSPATWWRSSLRSCFEIFLLPVTLSIPGGDDSLWMFALCLFLRGSWRDEWAWKQMCSRVLGHLSKQ